jgi:hypothetical protein
MTADGRFKIMRPPTRGVFKRLPGKWMVCIGPNDYMQERKDKTLLLSVGIGGSFPTTYFSTLREAREFITLLAYCA